MTLFGWDASDFDWSRGPMDLGSAYAAGIRFFTHKATESTNVKHTNFGEAMRRARDAGIPFLGAYHVVRSPRNAANEVDYFLNYVSQQFPEWRSHSGFFIQVDLEKWPYDAVPAGEGEDFADIVEVRTGKVAVIYASKGQYGNELSGTSHELWNANYPLNHTAGEFRNLYARAGGDSGPGWSAYSGRTPKIWQYTSSAVIGRQNTCDANAFRGSEEDFRAMIGGETMALMDDAYFAAVAWRLDALAAGLENVQDGPQKGEAFQANRSLHRIEAALTKVLEGQGVTQGEIEQLLARPTASLVITPELVAPMAEALAGPLGEKLVEATDNPLTEVDLAAIQARAKAAVEEFLRAKFAQ